METRREKPLGGYDVHSPEGRQTRQQIEVSWPESSFVGRLVGNSNDDVLARRVDGGYEQQRADGVLIGAPACSDTSFEFGKRRSQELGLLEEPLRSAIQAGD
jgi:hypothetical protein